MPATVTECLVLHLPAIKHILPQGCTLSLAITRVLAGVKVEAVLVQCDAAVPPSTHLSTGDAGGSHGAAGGPRSHTFLARASYAPIVITLTG